MLTVSQLETMMDCITTVAKLVLKYTVGIYCGHSCAVCTCVLHIYVHGNWFVSYFQLKEKLSVVCVLFQSLLEKKKRLLYYSDLFYCSVMPFHKQGVCPQMCFLIDNIVLSLIDCDIEFDLK